MNSLIRLALRSHLLMALLLTSGLLSVPTLSIAQPMGQPSTPPVSDVLDQQLVPSTPMTVRDTTSLNFYSYWKRANCGILTQRGAHAHRRSLRSMLDPVGHGLIAAENLSSLRGVSQLLCLNNTGAFVLSCTRNDGSVWSRSSFTCPSGEATDPITLFPADCHGLHVSTMEGRMVRIPTPLQPTATRRAAIQDLAHRQPTLAAWTGDATDMASLLNAEAESLPGYHQEGARALARTVLLGCDRAVNTHCPPATLAGTTATTPGPTPGHPPDPTQSPAYLELARVHTDTVQENPETLHKIHQLKIVICICFAITLLWVFWQIFKRQQPAPQETPDMSAEKRIAELEETKNQFVIAARTAEARHNQEIAQIQSAHATELRQLAVDEAARTAEVVAKARAELEEAHAQKVAGLTSQIEALAGTNEQLNRDFDSANAARLKLEAQMESELDRRTRAIVDNNSTDRPSLPVNNPLADVTRLNRRIVELTGEVDRVSRERDQLADQNAGLIVANARLERALAEAQPRIGLDVTRTNGPTTDDPGDVRPPSHTVPAGSGDPSSANPDEGFAIGSTGEMDRYTTTNRPPRASDITAMGRALIAPEVLSLLGTNGEPETADPAPRTDHRSAIAPPPGDAPEDDLASLLGNQLRDELGAGPNFNDTTAVTFGSPLTRPTEPAPRPPTEPGPPPPIRGVIPFGIGGEAPEVTDTDPDAATRVHDRESMERLVRQSTTHADTTQQIRLDEHPDAVAAIAASRGDSLLPPPTDVQPLVLDEDPEMRSPPGRNGRNKTTLEMAAPLADAAAARNGGPPSFGTTTPPASEPAPDEFQSGVRTISGMNGTHPGISIDQLPGAPAPGEDSGNEFDPLTVNGRQRT